MLHCKIIDIPTISEIVTVAVSGVRSTSFPPVRVTMKDSSGSTTSSSEAVNSTQFREFDPSNISSLVTEL